jgi:UDP-GlcNAc3NAcA epimerase
MKILTVVGARPQFIKAAVVSRAFSDAAMPEVMVHTGQHYDHNMSQVHFDTLGISPPAYNLEIAGGGHGAMTGRMMIALEEVMIKEKPSWVLVYGDTNSTLAAALVASKLHIPVAHVEAGLRSFNRKMPEEINRIVTDSVSNLLLCPTQTAVELLRAEGTTEGVHFVGDVMYDSVRYHLGLVEDVHRGEFVLATIHRPENTEHPKRLGSILAALNDLPTPVVLPLHPRTRQAIDRHSLILGSNIEVVPPMSYLDILGHMKHATAVLTDSGGIQKEAYFVQTPCITLRDETEWAETVACGANQVVGSSYEDILVAYDSRMMLNTTSGLFGDGTAGHKIAALIR